MEQDIFKIVVTGPESSGKTTLARDLAAVLGCACVPEFARPYVAHLGRPYVYNDLKTIALGQQIWEDWFCRQYAPTPLLVNDTDWTVIRIWEFYKYGSVGITTPPPLVADLYLLCSPDFDWHPDPLREHPHERPALFDLYLSLLRSAEARYQIMSGNPETRLETARQVIRKYC